MAEPIQITCDSVSDAPSIGQVETWSADRTYVVLQFPSGTTREQKLPIIEQLSSALPEHSVFDGGSNAEAAWVTVLPVISTQTVRENLSEIETGVQAYRDECSRLVQMYESDSLPPEYSIHEHGEHCCFTHQQTGQTVEAPLGGFGNDWVDPYFFALFVKSTPEFSSIASLLRYDFHDAARMLDILFGKQ